MMQLFSSIRQTRRRKGRRALCRGVTLIWRMTCVFMLLCAVPVLSADTSEPPQATESPASAQPPAMPESASPSPASPVPTASEEPPVRSDAVPEPVASVPPEASPEPSPAPPVERSEQQPLVLPGEPLPTLDPLNKDILMLSPPPHWKFRADAVPPWERLEEGLELGVFPARYTEGSSFDVVVLRIDPTRFDLTVETASGGGKPRSLREWAADKDLLAVINASMYLPDGQKSTGYLRSRDVVNNDRIVSKFGAFFVCDPDDPSLPAADVLDRSSKNWESLLSHYRMVAQNYRLINAARHLLWKPGGPRHSISAVSRDGTGKILFIHCREPITGVEFGNLLLTLPIDIRLVMYTEGGTQAGLLVRTPARNQVWMGRHFADFWTDGNEKAPLPNVIGVRRRQ